jgi:hypothetical protein
MELNAIVLAGQLVLSGILVWIALRKVPSERASADGSAAGSYAAAAKLAAEESLKKSGIITDLEHRLEILERKKYRVLVEFEIGDPPQVGAVKVEPVIPPLPPRPKKTGH